MPLLRASARWLILCAAVSAASLIVATPALAGTQTFSGSLTTSSPAFARPDGRAELCDLPTGLGGVTSFYSAQSFTVDTSGTYTIANTSNTFPAGPGFLAGDSFFALYQGSFDPANPLANLVATNDDFNFNQAQLSCALSAGTTYILVTTTFGDSVTGDFTNTITGPGQITLLSAPETAIEDLQTLVSGMGLPNGLTTALNSKLQQALDALAVDDSATACGALGAFLNQVQAQTGKKLDPGDAQELSDGASAIRTQLAC
jgi:hypothetical protein